MFGWHKRIPTGMNPSLILSCSNPPYCNLSYFILMCIIPPPLSSTLQRGVRPSCWPAAFSTTPPCSLDWTPGLWREPTLWSSPRASSRDPRTATARQRSSENSSYSNTLAEMLAGLTRSPLSTSKEIKGELKVSY